MPSINQAAGSEPVYPILLILGPSGVGKSYLSKCIKHECRYHCLHIDTDGGGKHTFEANGLPREWDSDPQSIDFACLLDDLQRHIGRTKRGGAVVSLPTTYRLSPKQLEMASRLGITPVVLWGIEAHCIRAAKERVERKGGTFNLRRYLERNRPTFEAYGRPEYVGFRVAAFRPDGSRWQHKEWLGKILALYAGPTGAPAAAPRTLGAQSNGDRHPDI